MANKMTRKDFWIHAFLACLHKHDPSEAVIHATEALALCDKQWEKPEYDVVTQLTSDLPVAQVNHRLTGRVKK